MSLFERDFLTVLHMPVIVIYVFAQKNWQLGWRYAALHFWDSMYPTAMLGLPGELMTIENMTCRKGHQQSHANEHVTKLFLEQEF